MTTEKSPRFWRVHSTNAIGSYSRPCLTVLEIAREVLSSYNDGRTYSLRLTELEYNDERTAGKCIVQDIRVKAASLRRGL